MRMADDVGMSTPKVGHDAMVLSVEMGDEEPLVSNGTKELPPLEDDGVLTSQGRGRGGWSRGSLGSTV